MSDIYLYNDEMWRVKYKFTYTGEKEEFRLPKGRYLCICKGAAGGTTNNHFQNKGGCSYGILDLSSPLKAYAVVGGEGGEGVMESPGIGGFNGGGNGGHSSQQGTYRHGAGGGGASDIRLTDQDVEQITITKQLPDEYDEVEYIETDNTQYIDLGVSFKPNTKIETSFWINSNNPSPYPTLFGTRRASTNNGLMFFLKQNGTWRPCYGCGNHEAWGVENSLPTETWYKAVVEGSNLTCYDENETSVISITSSGTLGTGEYPMYLFDLDQAGSPHPSSTNCNIVAKMRYFKMWEGDTLVRYMVPFNNPGTEIDTSSLTFEQGTIRGNGEDSSSDTRIRTIGYIPYPEDKLYTQISVTGSSTLMVKIMTYNNEGTVIADMDWVSSGTISHVDSNTRRIRLCIRRSDEGDISPEDLSSINIKVFEAETTTGMYDLVESKAYYDVENHNFGIGNSVVQKTTYTQTEELQVGLLSRIMVAGGAGGQGLQNGGHNDYADFTGYGGGVNGGYPYTKSGLPHNHEPATQTSGYSFGKGEDGVDRNQASSGSTYSLEGLAGAGGGWYGGFASNVTSTSESYSCSNAGGGSGYILTESSYKPEKYMYGITPREDLNFSDTLMTAGLSNESCVIICESINAYSSGDRLICDCIGSGTQFPLYGGQYKIMCSGGQGAHRTKTANARKGGYAEGILNNPDLTTAYAYVGGSSLYTTSSKGAEFIQTTHPTISFNGGGQPGGFGSVQQTATAGGGGTDLRIGTDSLMARVIVAGGAGGNGRFESYGGAGGGETGGTHVVNGYGTNYGPGKQNAAGSGSDANISGGFGYGGNGIVANGGYGGAGGGGWYGGSGTYPDGGSDDDYGGDGGSGYVLTSESFKPTGYLLGEEYYLTDTVLTAGGQNQLFPAPITGLVIEVIYASTSAMLAHDSDGYKYYDEENETWTYLKSDDITLEDFDEYGTYSFDNDTGLKDSYDIYIHDEYDTSNKMKFNVLPPPGDIKFRYHTEHTLTRYNIDSDIDESAIDFNVGIKRKGIAEDAYLYFDFKYNLHDIPKETTRVYCIQGFTQGASIEYHEPKKKEKTLEHIDLLPVGSSTRMPARFKNYIGSFINGSEAITTINSAVVCEHNRCIYSVTLCNDSIVRFAKLNLVNNTSTIIKDIPKSQMGNVYYGDIKVDDDYIYITASNNDSSYKLWRTPNSADPTINTYSVTEDNEHRIQATGKMEWYDDHTILLMMRKGLAFFDTEKLRFTYKMFADGTQNGVRRDYACGKKKIISLYTGTSKSAYVIDLETNACEGLNEVYGIEWSGTYLNNVCFHDGKFYVVQRNRLHVLDEETMTIDYSIPTPFTDIDPKQIVYGNGILYILMQNKPSLYMYDISTRTFYATGIPFTVDNWEANGWIRMCAFRGYCFIPQIRLYTINFVDRAKYNMGYKYDQFVIIMNKETSEVVDSQYEYDDRFVTFTDDNMQIHDGVIVVDMIEVDSTNHIKLVSMTKDQYNKIIKTSFTKVEDNESEGP